MSASAKVPGLPRSLLRPRFWEVAADRSDKTYASPFEKHRRLERRDTESMAEMMGIALDRYVAFEQGKVRSSPQDILAFCEALDLHPLDLYDEPYPGTPLPAELRDALLIASKSPSTSPESQDRIRKRFLLEQMRANAMVEANRDDLHFLSLSFSFSPFPYKNVFNHQASAERSLLGDVTASGDHDQRTMLNTNLIAYKLMLEDELVVHAELHRKFEHDARVNAAKMGGMASVLYKEKGPEAVGRIRSEIQKSGNIADINANLRKNPHLMGRLDPSATEGEAVSSMAEDGQMKLRLRQRYLLHTVNLDLRYDQILPNQEESMSKAHRALKAFEAWRENPRTQCLLDWIENGLVLDKHMGSDGSLRENLDKKHKGTVPAP